MLQSEINNDSVASCKPEGIIDVSNVSTGKILQFSILPYENGKIILLGERDALCLKKDSIGFKLTQVASRNSSFQIENGFRYYDGEGPCSNVVTGEDSVSVSTSECKRKKYPAYLQYRKTAGEDIILEEGDTIRNVVKHVCSFYFYKEADGRKAAFTDIRWMARGWEYPLLQLIRYTGWNGDAAEFSVTAQRFAGQQMKSELPKMKKTNRLEGICICDLSGKVWKTFDYQFCQLINNKFDISKCNLPKGAYIITYRYNDHEESVKIMIAND